MIVGRRVERGKGPGSKGGRGVAGWANQLAVQKNVPSNLSPPRESLRCQVVTRSRGGQGRDRDRAEGKGRGERGKRARLVAA